MLAAATVLTAVALAPRTVTGSGETGALLRHHSGR